MTVHPNNKPAAGPAANGSGRNGHAAGQGGSETAREQTFSGRLRSLLLDQAYEDAEQAHLCFMAFAAVALRSGPSWRLATRFPALALWIQERLAEDFGAQCQITEHQELSVITLENRTVRLKLKAALDAFLRRNPTQLGQDSRAESNLSIRRAILRGLFLGCGFIADPRERYHLEFSIPSRSVALWFGLLLEHLGFVPGRIEHQGCEVLYFKEGEILSDFLLVLGADQSMLEFEQTRVEKEMRNQVNRMVNCDSANAQRLADSVARQLRDIRLIERELGLDQLPETLRETARIRLEYDVLSLRELGEMMDPPLGKSGMNHRLKKLSAIADEIREHAADD